MQHIPVAGYISRPRSRDVVNALRVGLCPETAPNCDRCPYKDLPKLPCAEIEGIERPPSCLNSYSSPENGRQSLPAPRVFSRHMGRIVSGSSTYMWAQKLPALKSRTGWQQPRLCSTSCMPWPMTRHKRAVAIPSPSQKRTSMWWYGARSVTCSTTWLPPCLRSAAYALPCHQRTSISEG